MQPDGPSGYSIYKYIMTVIDNYHRIEKEIAAIAASRGRDPETIRIIAVCKTFEAAVVQEAIDSGIRLFGENKVQEAKRKIPGLRGDFTFHMVGHLQSNKARDAVGLFDYIHSIDSPGTAQKVDHEAERIGKVEKILVQVNASGETSKSGVPPEMVPELVEQLMGLKNTDLLGFMTMAPFTDDEHLIRRSFRIARQLLEDINARFGLELRELSMGMSGDYRVAVEEGSTLVRIGTAIFGQRT
jgi:pyridoxal phosphate enzyme (YggS family)